MRWMSVLLLAGWILTVADTGLSGGQGLRAQEAVKTPEEIIRDRQATIDQLTIGNAALANELQATKQELENVRKQLETARKSLGQLQKAHMALQKALDALQKAIGNEVKPSVHKAMPKKSKGSKPDEPKKEDLKKEEGTAATVGNETNSIVFEGEARFACVHGGLSAFINGRPPLLIYEDMTLEFDAAGNYTLSFAAESPRTDVILNLELRIPYDRPTEPPTMERRMVMSPSDSGAVVPTLKATPEFAILTIPPIHLAANEGIAKSSTVQFFESQPRAKGKSKALAIAFGCCGSQTVYIPAQSPNEVAWAAGPEFPKRNGSALVGTIVK